MKRGKRCPNCDPGIQAGYTQFFGRRKKRRRREKHVQGVFGVSIVERCRKIKREKGKQGTKNTVCTMKKSAEDVDHISLKKTAKYGGGRYLA